MTRHVVVVGAGIVGLCAARELRARGHEVTIVERGAPDRDGASFGNAGIVVPSHFVPLAAPGIVWQGLKWMADPASPFYVRPRASWDLVTWGLRFAASANAAHVRRSGPALLALNLASRRLFVELAHELGPEAVAFAERGLLMLCKTHRALEEEAHLATTARDLGLAVEVLDRAAVGAAEPDVELDVVGAVRYADDAHLDPGAVMRSLQSRLRADAGVRFRFGAEAVDVPQKHGRGTGVAIRTHGADARGGVETVSADAVVLCAGTWAAGLGRALGVRLMLQPGKGYSVTIDAAAPTLRAAAILVEARASATAYGDRLRIGGTMELAGFDGDRSEVRLEGIKRAARAYLPGIDRAALDAGTVWSGLRPVSPDGLPYLGPAARVPNAIVAAGHAMMGFSTGPITGRIVAELVDGEPPSVDLTVFRPDRHGRA